jgi:hypothetical protein
MIRMTKIEGCYAKKILTYDAKGVILMNNFCESHPEEAILEWFEELVYEIVFASNIASEGEHILSTKISVR